MSKERKYFKYNYFRLVIQKGMSTSGVYRFRTKGQQWIFLQTHYNLLTNNTEPHSVYCKNHLININDALMYKNSLPMVSRSSSVSSQLSVNVDQQPSPPQQFQPHHQQQQQQHQQQYQHHNIQQSLNQIQQQSMHQINHQSPIQQQQQQHSPSQNQPQQSPQQHQSPLVSPSSSVTNHRTTFNEFKSYKKLDYFNYRNENSNSNSSQHSMQMKAPPITQQPTIEGITPSHSQIGTNNSQIDSSLMDNLRNSVKDNSLPSHSSSFQLKPTMETRNDQQQDTRKGVSKLILMSYQQPSFRKYVCTQLLLFKSQHEEKIKTLQEKVGQFEEIIKFFQDGK